MSTKLAYLLKKFPRLSETFVLGEILGQEALGREVVVYSRREPDDEPRHPELARLAAEIRFVPGSSDCEPFGLLLDLSTHEPELLRRLGRALDRLAPIGLVRTSKLVAEALWLLEDTRRRGISHVHVHFATESAIVANILHALGGPSYSITAHAKDIYRNTVDTRLLDLLVRDSCFTVTVCDANVAHLEERLGPVARSHVRRLYNGIDRATFESIERRPVARRVLSVGRLVEKKGFDTLCDALLLLSRRGVPVDTEVIGDGEDRDALIRRVGAAGLSERIRFLGALPADRVREHLAQAALFVLPCRIGRDGNRDALPTVLLEAQAARVPIVSCAVAGVSEILDRGRAGILVEQDDSCALADAIEQALAEPEPLDELVQHGAELGARCFDRSTQAAKLSDWFDEALANSEVPCASRT